MPTIGLQRSRAPGAAWYELWCVDNSVKGRARPELWRLHIQAAYAAEWQDCINIFQQGYQRVLLDRMRWTATQWSTRSTCRAESDEAFRQADEPCAKPVAWVTYAAS